MPRGSDELSVLETYRGNPCAGQSGGNSSRHGESSGCGAGLMRVRGGREGSPQTAVPSKKSWAISMGHLQAHLPSEESLVPQQWA